MLHNFVLLFIHGEMNVVENNKWEDRLFYLYIFGPQLKRLYEITLLLNPNQSGKRINKDNH